MAYTLILVDDGILQSSSFSCCSLDDFTCSIDRYIVSSITDAKPIFSQKKLLHTWLSHQGLSVQMHQLVGVVDSVTTVLCQVFIEEWEPLNYLTLPVNDPISSVASPTFDDSILSVVAFD